MGISIVIPSRNEPYLQKTIQSLLISTSGIFEILVILDGYWCEPYEIVDNPYVVYAHFSEPHGMRNAINAGVALAKYDYILKTDAHCLFKKGFDKVLIDSHKNNWVQVPRRYALDVKTWDIEKRSDNKYPVDYMYLDNTLHGQVWTKKNNITDTLPEIDDLMSSQGSCWFMTKEYYHELELLDDEKYGTFWSEFQEIGLKCWLSGGEVKVNKKTWYAHWHKTKGRGYSLKDNKEKTEQEIAKWKKHPQFEVFINKFKPVPTWEK